MDLHIHIALRTRNSKLKLIRSSFYLCISLRAHAYALEPQSGDHIKLVNMKAWMIDLHGPHAVYQNDRITLCIKKTMDPLRPPQLGGNNRETYYIGCASIRKYILSRKSVYLSLGYYQQYTCPTSRPAHPHYAQLSSRLRSYLDLRCQVKVQAVRVVSSSNLIREISVHVP